MYEENKEIDSWQIFNKNSTVFIVVLRMPSLWQSCSLLGGFDYSPWSCLGQWTTGNCPGFWVFDGGFLCCFCSSPCRWTSACFNGFGTGVGVGCRSHCCWVEGCLRSEKSWWCSCRFELDSVPSNQGTMRGTNSVGPAVVRLDHFPIDPGFAAMTGWWFGICVTPNLGLCSTPTNLL